MSKPPGLFDQQHIFDHMAEGFAVLDANWRVLQMNAAGLRNARRTAAQVIGRNHWEIWPATVGTELESVYRRVMRTGRSESLKQLVPFEDGPAAVFEVNAQKSPDGMLAIFFRDVTLLDTTTRALERSQARAEAAITMARLGSFSCNRRSGRMECSALARQIFGFAPGHGGAWPEYAQRIVDEDRARTQQALDACLASGQDMNIQFRIRHPDGSFHHVLCQGAMEHGDGGSREQLAGVFQDVTERVSKAQGLLDVSQRKDAFLGLLAHELRNPLAPIVTAAALLRRSDLAPARVRGMGDLIQRQAGRMSALLADLLDVSRIHNGLLTLTRTTLDLHAVLADAIEQTGPMMEMRLQRFTLEAPPGELPVDGDEGRMVQVFANILNNASKYTPAGGTIRLSVESTEHEVVVTVRDSGVGMAPELLPHVFESFTQAERSSDRSVGGLGLGLALVKNLVELHGGRVTAHSAGLGRGSELTVALPRAGLRPTRNRRAAGERGSVRQEDLRIVVVDDNADATSTLATLLEMEGHSVAVMNDPHQVLAGLDDALSDVYILNIGMPGMDGHQLARSLRERCGQGPLLIAVTGYGSVEDREKSAAAGINCYFEKPIDPARLLDVICKAPRQGASGMPGSNMPG